MVYDRPVGDWAIGDGLLAIEVVAEVEGVMRREAKGERLWAKSRKSKVESQGDALQAIGVECRV